MEFSRLSRLVKRGGSAVSWTSLAVGRATRISGWRFPTYRISVFTPSVPCMYKYSSIPGIFQEKERKRPQRRRGFRRSSHVLQKTCAIETLTARMRYGCCMNSLRIATYQGIVDVLRRKKSEAAHYTLNPSRTAVSFWGQLGTNCLEFDCLVPKTGLEFERG